MHIDLILWAVCFAALWASFIVGKMQGGKEISMLWQTTLKKIVDETEDEFKREFLGRLIEKLKLEIARFRNETLSE